MNDRTFGALVVLLITTLAGILIATAYWNHVEEMECMKLHGDMTQQRHCVFHESK